MEDAYIIRRIGRDDCLFAAAERGARAAIASYPWQRDYTPRAEVFVARSEDALRVCLTAWERRVRCEYGVRNDPVCRDSCLEFFFSPEPARSNAYFNFEVNPLGTMYIGFSPTGTRAGSEKITDAPDNAYFRMTTRLQLSDTPDSRWQVAYDIPFDFIRRYSPGFTAEGGELLKGNFYKCGDMTPCPHWGSWSPIGTKQPDFHVPAYFGAMRVE